jgi:hypothetical protein
MKQQELSRQLAVLKSLIRRAGHDSSTHELEMLAHWGRYLCVLVAGFVENVVRLSYAAYVRKTADARTARFAMSQVDDIQNPKAARLIEVASLFDPTWGSELESFLGQNFRREAVNTIMSNRHLIAHGRDSQITLSQVDQYLIRIVEIAEHIETQCKL